MNYRLTKYSKNFGKVWWSGHAIQIDLQNGKVKDTVPSISFSDDKFAHLSIYDAEYLLKLFNANLGPNSPHWIVEEVS